MPAAVSTGRQPGVRACALCHLPTGGGHPESANMAGLPVRYIIRSMEEYKNGNRVGVRAATMIDIAKAMNDEEIRASANTSRR